jgi:hypothetical protein
MPKALSGRKTVLLNGVAVGEVISMGDPEKDAKAAQQLLKSKGLHKEPTPFQAIFSQAHSFANTSALLYVRDLKRHPRTGASIVPFVVNTAFAIELYLKALAQKHGVSLRGHELIKLHKALPARALAEVKSVTTKCAVNRSLGEDPDFRKYLANLNNAFVDWRYSYELDKTGTVHIEPALFVMEVLHEACRLPAA